MSDTTTSSIEKILQMSGDAQLRKSFEDFIKNSIPVMRDTLERSAKEWCNVLTWGVAIVKLERALTQWHLDNPKVKYK